MSVDELAKRIESLEDRILDLEVAYEVQDEAEVEKDEWPIGHEVYIWDHHLQEPAAIDYDDDNAAHQSAFARGEMFRTELRCWDKDAELKQDYIEMISAFEQLAHDEQEMADDPFAGFATEAS